MSYEKEQRLLVRSPSDEKEPVLFDYPREAVKGIVIGERISKAFRARLEKVAAERYPDIPVTIARRSAETYRIEIEGPNVKTDAGVRIAILGWGSLIRNAGEIPLASEWQPRGPVLPIEFSRVSRDGRLTLVIDEKHGVDVPTLYALSADRDLEAAIESLRKREGSPRNRIGFFETHTGRFSDWAREQHPIALGRIQEWVRQHGLDAVIWTALGPTFESSTGKTFTPEEAVKYLQLRGSMLPPALEYIRNAPATIQTPARREIERAFPVSNS